VCVFLNCIAIRWAWRQPLQNREAKRHMRKRNLPAIVAAIITIGCITISAQTVTTLHSFNGSDGQSPNAALVQASDGNFYGTTAVGGAHSEGMAFKITAAGTLTTLHSFSGF